MAKQTKKTESSKPKRKSPRKKASERSNAEERFVEGVVTRGEAAKTDKGKLPPGATHEIVEEKEGELPKIERRRFSLL